MSGVKVYAVAENSGEVTVWSVLRVSVVKGCDYGEGVLGQDYFETPKEAREARRQALKSRIDELKAQLAEAEAQARSVGK